MGTMQAREKREGCLISQAAGLVGMGLPGRLDQRQFGKGNLGPEGPTKGFRAGAQLPPLHLGPLSHY